MTADPPLSTLLSQVLIAFTIEFDNEAEGRLAHTTTAGRQAGEPVRGPWLVSLVMWANFMRFVDENETRLRELREQARMTNLNGLQRWGYIVVAPDPDDPRGRSPRGDWLVRVTPRGRVAAEIWRPLAGVIEARWEERFGKRAIAELRAALEALLARVDLELPHYLPVAGVHRREHDLAPATARSPADVAALDLSALLAQALFAFTLDFERRSRLSLAICANALRVLDTDGLRVSELPRLTGVSKEAISASLGLLARHGLVVVEASPGEARTKIARLTENGQRSQRKSARLLAAVEQDWRARFGEEAVERLRASLQELLERRADGRPLMSAGLVPYPDGWRARKPYLAQTEATLDDPGSALPHQPMVSHRGGFPDGS